MEFKLNKTDRLITNAASKDTSRPPLHCVQVRKGLIEAANGYILAQRKIDYDGDNILLDIDSIARHKDCRSLGGVVYSPNGEDIRALGEDEYIIKPQTMEFPNIDELYPKGEPVFKIALGRDQLLNMLKCLDKYENTIKFTFYSKTQPVKIETDDVKGLIMPIDMG